MMTRTITAAAVATMMAGMALAGCAIEKQEAPAASGPSELATSISVSASPDILRQDGASQSQITVQAQDAKGQAFRNLPIRLDIYLGNAIVDFGELSLKSVTTGTDGRATVLYTAPPPPAQAVDSQTVVRIVATPVGTDYANAVERAVSIRLVPLGVVLPPNGAPTASFVFSPSSPLTQAPITFDGSSSFDLDGRIVSYAWNFGDGSTGTGSPVQHQYTLGGGYSVTLTVTDDRGLTNAKSQSITVSDAANPTASFEFSPTAPKINDNISFNAAASTASVGRKIVRYDWDFGSGTPQSGIIVSKSYDVAATYVVTLTVTDDANKKHVTSKPVVIASDNGGIGPTAVFSVSEGPALVNVPINVDASKSTGQIVVYEWNFGDNAQIFTTASRTYTHVYGEVGKFTITLTVRDNIGRANSASQSVTIGTPFGPSANFTFTPSPGAVNGDVTFDGTTSTGAPVRYEWTFGDGPTVFTGSVLKHRYAAAGSYAVTLTVTDAAGRQSSISRAVIIQ